MKQKWSPKWKSSVQPRKQRKYRHNAPLHIRHKFLGARLSETLTKQYGKRSLPVRKGDEIMVMRGSVKGKKGAVDHINMKESKVYVEGITVKKVDGSEVMKALQPSNLMITKTNMGDKKRQSILDRAGKKKEKGPKENRGKVAVDKNVDSKSGTASKEDKPKE